MYNCFSLYFLAVPHALCTLKDELNLLKYHLVPKMKLTLSIVQNICRIGQFKMGREQAVFN